MAHCKKEDLEDCEDLLNQIRNIPGQVEKPYARFYRKSKSVIHFHISCNRRFAHVWDGSEWREVGVPVGLKKSKILFKTIVTYERGKGASAVFLF